MSLANYNDLLAAIDGSSGYLHRTDLTARIPDWVKLAESELNSDFQHLLEETETTLTAIIGSRYISLPVRFNTPAELWCTTYLPRIEIFYRSPQQLPVSVSNGAARYYTIDGSNLATDNPADLAYTYTLRYLPSLDLATTTTNYVMTSWPKAYLFGTLLQSIGITRDFSQQAYWQSEYDNAIEKAMLDSSVIKSKQTLRCDDFILGRRPNIIRGF